MDTIVFNIKRIDHELWLVTADTRGQDLCWRTSRTNLYTNMEEITTALENRYPGVHVAFYIV